MKIELVTVNLKNDAIFSAWLALLDQYAQDPMGGSTCLTDYAKNNLRNELQDHPGFHAALAFSGDQVVGLINCFTGFSTFAAKPLLNIHDVVVPEVHRGQGIGQTLLSWAEAKARQLGCCKLTLEVLSNNTHALAAYKQAGYAPYMLDPAVGHALLMQKILSES